MDVDGDGNEDLALPRRPAVHFGLGLVAPLIFFFGLQLISAGVFVAVEGWDYGTAFYHCMTTATTVGFGSVAGPEAGVAGASRFGVVLSR